MSELEFDGTAGLYWHGAALREQVCPSVRLDHSIQRRSNSEMDFWGCRIQ